MEPFWFIGHCFFSVSSSLVRIKGPIHTDNNNSNNHKYVAQLLKLLTFGMCSSVSMREYGFLEKKVLTFLPD